MEEEIIFDETGMSTSKKIIFIIVVLLLIVGGTILFFRTYNFNVKKTITYELGDELSFEVLDYITNKPMDTKSYKLDLDGVSYDDNHKLTSVGEFTYRVSLKDTIKEGKIIVKDTKAPEVEVIDLTVGVDEEYNISDFVVSCKDSSLPCTYEQEGLPVGTSKEGTYTGKVIVKDEYSNVTKKDVTLTVKKDYSLKDDKINDLTAKYTEPNYGDWNNQYVISYGGAFDPEDYDNYRWQYYYDFLNSDYNTYLSAKDQGKTVKSAEVIAVYNKYKYIIGFAARATLSDGTITYLTNGE